MCMNKAELNKNEKPKAKKKNRMFEEKPPKMKTSIIAKQKKCDSKVILPSHISRDLFALFQTYIIFRRLHLVLKFLSVLLNSHFNVWETPRENYIIFCICSNGYIFSYLWKFCVFSLALIFISFSLSLSLPNEQKIDITQLRVKETEEMKKTHTDNMKKNVKNQTNRVPLW